MNEKFLKANLTNILFGAENQRLTWFCLFLSNKPVTKMWIASENLVCLWLSLVSENGRMILGINPPTDYGSAGSPNGKYVAKVIIISENTKEKRENFTAPSLHSPYNWLL